MNLATGWSFLISNAVLLRRNPQEENLRIFRNQIQRNQTCCHSRDSCHLVSSEICSTRKNPEEVRSQEDEMKKRVHSPKNMFPFLLISAHANGYQSKGYTLQHTRMQAVYINKAILLQHVKLNHYSYYSPIISETYSFWMFWSNHTDIIIHPDHSYLDTLGYPSRTTLKLPLETSRYPHRANN